METNSIARLRDHLYIFGTIAFTAYSQTIMRWRVLEAGPLPDTVTGKFLFIGRLFMEPWVISSIAATLLAGISWMLAMSRFELSYAYPWVGLNFILMFAMGTLFFNEPFQPIKLAGTLLVICGLALIARS